MKKNKMYLRIILVLAMGFMSLYAKAYNNPLDEIKPLSKLAEFSLLTCDQGNQLYATFGHSALRLQDPVKHVDIVFNYGTFNFETPNFYGKFASGRLLYTLSVENRERFMRKYVNENLTVVEQKLNLSYWQKQDLYNAIAENYKPENRYYKYDFIYDNCATRIRDLFEDTFGDSLVYEPTDIVEQKTFRGMLHEYLLNSKWSDFGITLMLGNVVDAKVDERDKAFIPDYLMDYCNKYHINGEQFVIEQSNLIEGGSEVPVTLFFASPQFLVWLLFACFLFFQIYKFKSSWIIADKTIFFVIGIFGLVIFMGTLFTDHFAMKSNMNILWANPIYILYAFLVSDKRTKLKAALSVILLLGNISVLIGWGNIQVFHVLVIPLIVITSVRLIAYLLIKERNEND